MPSPFETEEEAGPQNGSPFDVTPQPVVRKPPVKTVNGYRDPKQPGYTFFPTGHVVRDNDQKVWDPSTRSWYYMTEQGMSPEYGKADIPAGEDTRLDTLNLLRRIGSPVMPSMPDRSAQPISQPEQDSGIVGFAKGLYGAGKATAQKATSGLLHLAGGIQEEVGDLGIGLRKLASGRGKELTTDEIKALNTVQAGGPYSSAILHALAIGARPTWQKEAAQTTKGAAESVYGQAKESEASVPQTRAGKTGAFIGGLLPHLTPLAPLTMAAEAGESGYRSALEEGADNETSILSGLAQAGVAGTLGSINKIGQLSRSGLEAIEPVLSKYPRLWSVLSKEVQSGAPGPATRWLGNLVRGSAKTGAEFAVAGMANRGIGEAANPTGGSPLGAALQPSEIGHDILTGAAFHAVPEVVGTAGRGLKGLVTKTPVEPGHLTPEQREARILAQEAAAKETPELTPETFPEVPNEEVGAYKGRELPPEIKEQLLRHVEEQPSTARETLEREPSPWPEEGLAPGEEYARSVVDEAARRRQEAAAEKTEAVRAPNRSERLESLQRGMTEEPNTAATADRALMLREQLQTPFEPFGNTKDGMRELKAREGTRRELANLDADLGGLTDKDRRSMVVEAMQDAIDDYTRQFKSSPGSRKVQREIDRLRGEMTAIKSGSMPAKPVIESTKPSRHAPVAPTLEMPIPEAGMGLEKLPPSPGEEYAKSVVDEGDRRRLEAEEATPETPLEPSRMPQDVPIETQPIVGESRPEEAIPESKNIQPSVEYLNSGLNLQHAIADVLGVKRGSSWSEMAPVAMEKIGRLGKTVAETTIRIMEKIKGITREAAQILAKSLHESFSGSRESQTGAVNPEALKAAREQQRAERESIKASDMSAEERREAYKQITNIDALLRNHDIPSTQPEVTELAKAAASPARTKPERVAAAKKVVESMAAGNVPQFSDIRVKPNGDPDLGDYLRALQIAFTGDGLMRENGAKIVVKPMIEYDPIKTVASVRRDLTKAERLYGRIGSASHTYTGSLSLGVEGEAGAKTVGAMSPVDNPVTDIHLAQSSAFANSVHVGQHLMDTLARHGITNNHFRLVKELEPTNRYWSEAHKAFADAQEAHESNKSEATKRTLDTATTKLNLADKVMNEHLREIYADPTYSDARVMALADAARGGKEVPEWLDKLSSKSEKAAAVELTNQMQEIKRALQDVGIPVREDFGVPHTVKNWIINELPGRKIDTSKMSPESIEFKHRSERSILTMPDAYGMVEDYIPHAMSMVAKRAVANKWNYVANEIQGDKKALADQINRDVANYHKGEGGIIPWMDKINNWFANYLVGYRTATAVKHLAKYPLELANASPIKSAMGWINFLKASQKDPELKAILKEMTNAAKGPRYNPLPDIGGAEDVTGKAKTVGQKIAASSHYPMQAVEGALRGNTFRMDLLGNIKKGMEPREAVADAVFRSLMVNFQATDKPALMRTSVGRSIFFLQQTVWKIMECNVRAFTDSARGVKRGVETAITGEKLSPEEKGRYSQAARQIGALVAMYYIGKKTNTKLFDWIFENPALVNALVKKPLTMMAKNAVAATKGEKQDWHFDPTEELMSGVSATQAFQTVEKAAKEYGFGSKGFFAALSPLAAQDIFMEPSKYQQKRTGTGAEALVRRVTGLTKAEEEEKAKEKMQLGLHKKQDAKSEKLVKRLRNPLDVIAPSSPAPAAPSNGSPFDKE